MPMPCAEKTLCERRLAALPQATGLFYYQRIELNSAAQCAERCVDDWEFCRSAVLIEDSRNKSLCQLYSGSFESRIPLNLPAFAPVQTDPNNLLPITLVELTDAPCSSKFARQSTIFDQISADAREQLRMIPGPAVRNRLDIAMHSSEKKPKNDNGSADDHEQIKTAGEEHSEKASADQTYLAPFSSASSSIAESREQFSSSSSSNGYVVPLGHQPAPLQFPPNGLPIQPVFVSRGNQQQQYNIGCPNGICQNIGAQLSTYNDHNDATVTQPPCAARKNSDPCAPQAQWMEWSATGSCSVTCGIGWRERRRYCSTGSQSKCRGGESTDREKCVMPPCDNERHQQWTEWTEWTQCSRSCGGGQQTKRRLCQNGGEQCDGQAVETRRCNDEQCPTWSNWGPWTECSATCGTGTQRRMRECEPQTRHNANPICPIGAAVEHRECELRSCPEWSQWEPWSACSKSCGAGESVRRRECRNAASKDECHGANMESLLCNTQLCPAWTTWTEWSQCSKSCGTGATQTRKRECHYNGMLSDGCSGAAKDEKQCKQLEACPNWAEWGQWSDCTTSCGHGQQSRIRKCLGQGCVGNEKEVRICQKTTCPYFDQWSGWGGCSVTCGRGFCERRRKCIKSNNEDHQSDNKKLVPFEGLMPIREAMLDGTKHEQGPEDITSVDTIRPRTLEVVQSSAVQRRSPLIRSTKLGLLDEENGFVDQSETALSSGKLYDTKIVPVSAGECVGPSVERKACDAGPCCKWAQWSPWSDCIVQCGSTGYRDRTRRCEMAQMEDGTKMDDGNRFAGPIPQFGSSRNVEFGASGPLRCAATVCGGESRQTESCAIPTPKNICGGGTLADQPRFDHQRVPTVPILRKTKMKPELSLKGDSNDAAYITAGKFGRRAVDTKTQGNDSEHDEDDSDIDLIGAETAKNERKRSTPSTNDEDGQAQAVTASTVDEHGHNCTWTQWSPWSDCGGADCSKRRSRTCVSQIMEDQTKCQCEGNYVQQTKCPPGECQQKNSNENAGQMATYSPGSTIMKMEENKVDSPPSPSSFIKRLQVIPRHKPSAAEKRPEEQLQALTDQPSSDSVSAKLIRISGLRVSGNDQNQQNGHKVPSSSSATTTAINECAVDDWLQWSEWSACNGGFCGNNGTGRPREGQRTRHRHCACKRGCAGIAEESVSCTLTNCP